MLRAFVPALMLLVLPLAVAAQARLPGDANGDARLSFEEFRASRHALMMKADRDGDGRIGPAEWLAGETMIRRALASAGFPDRDIDLGTGGFGKLDANHDRWIDGAEIDAYLAERFKQLDTDHDGQLTPEEFKRGVTAGGRY